jgi:hypothetical protein
LAGGLSVAGFAVSLRRRERIAAGVSIVSLAPIALVVAAVLVIALGGGRDR